MTSGFFGCFVLWFVSNCPRCSGTEGLAEPFRQDCIPRANFDTFLWSLVLDLGHQKYFDHFFGRDLQPNFELGGENWKAWEVGHNLRTFPFFFSRNAEVPCFFSPRNSETPVDMSVFKSCFVIFSSPRFPPAEVSIFQIMTGREVVQRFETVNYFHGFLRDHFPNKKKTNDCSLAYNLNHVLKMFGCQVQVTQK